MPQSLAHVWLYIVFFTKERRPFLQDESFRKEMFRMLAHHLKNAGCISASVGSHIEHVYLLVGLLRTITIAKLVENIETETSKWAKSSRQGSTVFSWQSGYGVFSVSHMKRDAVDNNIRRQSEHHATISFRDELRLMCERHGIDIDERYIWD